MTQETESPRKVTWGSGPSDFGRPGRSTGGVGPAPIRPFDGLDGAGFDRGAGMVTITGAAAGGGGDTVTKLMAAARSATALIATAAGTRRGRTRPSNPFRMGCSTR